MDSLIVLVHSPLVGPFTWSLVAQHLQAGGFDVLVPTLTDSGETPPPYWQQHTACVQQALVSIPQERPLVLVGHSGAGSLLPVLAQADRHPVKAYLFVDAGLPHPGQSQLEEMEASVPAFAQELRRLLASGERFPNWSDAPGGYLMFTQGYRHFLEQAQSAGWPSRMFHAGHFYMLVDPITVAAVLIELMKQMNEKL
jgi:pimeloyl-ACP methyl ester carboxylesterase